MKIFTKIIKVPCRLTQSETETVNNCLKIILRVKFFINTELIKGRTTLPENITVENRKATLHYCIKSNLLSQTKLSVGFDFVRYSFRI